MLGPNGPLSSVSDLALKVTTGGRAAASADIFRNPGHAGAVISKSGAGMRE
jgi:hypothetical protein